jgi:signal transduction histidine kinase/Tfp pilus assembly protein PilF
MKKSIPFLLFFSLCISFFVSGQESSKIDSLEKSLANAKEDTSKINILVALCKEISNSGNHTKGLQFCNEALSLSAMLKYRKGSADAYTQIGHIYFKKSDYEESQKNHTAALNIRIQVNDKIELADSYNDLGVLFGYQEKYDDAFKYLLTAYKISEEEKDKRGMARYYSNTGLLHSRKGEYPEALKNYFKAIKIYEEEGLNTIVAGQMNNIGVIYKKQGKYEEALKVYNDALKAIEESGDKISISKAHSNIGVVYSAQDKFEKALEHYTIALKLGEEIGAKKVLADAYNNIGVVFKKRGSILYTSGEAGKAKSDFENALQNHYSALKVKKEIGGKPSIAASYSNLGLVYTLLEKFDSARAAFNKGLEYAGTTQKELISNIYGGMSQLDSAQAASSLTATQDKIKFWSSAYNNFKKSVALKDSMLNEESSKLTAEMKTKYETEKKDKEIETLNKVNALKELTLKQREASLLAAKLSAQQNESEISLLNKDKEVQELQLQKQKEESDKMKSEAALLEARTNLLAKEKALQTAEAAKQRQTRNYILIILVLVIVSGTLAFTRFRQSYLKKRIAERARISHDLHDDIGSNLSKIALLGEVVKQNYNYESKVHLDKIISSSHEALQNMSEIVWALNPKNDMLENLTSYTRKYAMEYCDVANIKCKVNLHGSIPNIPLSGEQRRSIFLSVKEALHNIVKHSGAAEAEISFIKNEREFEVMIRDNGKGFHLVNNHFGNGLQSMQKRMTEIGGKFSVENKSGTTVRFSVPLT